MDQKRNWCTRRAKECGKGLGAPDLSLACLGQSMLPAGHAAGPRSSSSPTAEAERTWGSRV